MVQLWRQAHIGGIRGLTPNKRSFGSQVSFQLLVGRQQGSLFDRGVLWGGFGKIFKGTEDGLAAARY
jgi:hypothetical protein